MLKLDQAKTSLEAGSEGLVGKRAQRSLTEVWSRRRSVRKPPAEISVGSEKSTESEAREQQDKWRETRSPGSPAGVLSPQSMSESLTELTENLPRRRRRVKEELRLLLLSASPGDSGWTRPRATKMGNHATQVSERASQLSLTHSDLFGQGESPKKTRFLWASGFVKKSLSLAAAVLTVLTRPG